MIFEAFFVLMDEWIKRLRCPDPRDNFATGFSRPGRKRKDVTFAPLSPKENPGYPPINSKSSEF